MVGVPVEVHADFLICLYQTFDHVAEDRGDIVLCNIEENACLLSPENLNVASKAFALAECFNTKTSKATIISVDGLETFPL